MPEFFIRFLTDPGDLVIDPFGGSGITGEVCERLHRQWQCIEIQEVFLMGALSRFGSVNKISGKNINNTKANYYHIPKVNSLWSDIS